MMTMIMMMTMMNDNDDVHCIKDEDEVEVGIISLSGW